MCTFSGKFDVQSQPRYSYKLDSYKRKSVYFLIFAIGAESTLKCPIGCFIMSPFRFFDLGLYIHGAPKWLKMQYFSHFGRF